MKYGWLFFLCALAVTWAVFGHIYLFPYLSNNTDEAVYILQANALLKGKLWLDETSLSPFFMTWFEKVYNHKIVFKYTPVYAAILAAGKYLTGYFEASLAVVAAAVVTSMYAFCREMGMTRKASLIATAFLQLSPLFLILSTTYLSYCSFLALLLIFTTLFMRGLRLDSRIYLLLSGIVLGIAFFERPYDAILVGSIGIIFFPVWKGQWRPLLRHTAWLLGGFAPIFVLVLLFNWETTGNALIFPFRQDELDTFGFGVKRVFAGVGFDYFDLDAAFDATTAALWQLALWSFSGLLTPVLALGYILKKRLRRKDYTLCALLLIFLAGYMFFWGIYNLMSWGALYYLGPFYYLPCMVTISVFAARAVCLLMKRSRVLSRLDLALVMPAITYYLFTGIIHDNLQFTTKFDHLYEPLQSREDMEKRSDLILVPPLYGDYLLHPLRMLSNDGTESGPVIYALNRGMDNFKLFDAYPDRTVFRFDVYGIYDENPLSQSETQLIPQTLKEQKEKRLTIKVTTPAQSHWVRICILTDIQEKRCLWDETSAAGKTYKAVIKVTAEALLQQKILPMPKGPYAQSLNGLKLSEGNPLIIRAEFSFAPQSHGRPDNTQVVTYEYRYFIRKHNHKLQSVEPPEQWMHNYATKGWFLSHSDLLRLQ